MATFEESLYRDIRRTSGLGWKILVGGLLSFFPVLNIWALGYLYRYAEGVRRNDGLQLPDWKDPLGLFLDGLKFLVITLLWFWLPVFIAWIIALLLTLLTLGLLAMPAMILPVATAVFCAPLTVSALILFQRRGGDWAALVDRHGVVRPVLRTQASLVLPVLAYAGWLAVGAPLYGFAFFSGTVMLLAYQTLVFKRAFGRVSPSTD